LPTKSQIPQSLGFPGLEKDAEGISGSLGKTI